MTHPPTGTRTITSIDVHAEGEVGRILIGAHLLVRGTTWSERMRWCETELDWLRRLVLREPRGHPSMCGVLVLQPLDPGADVGIIILEQGGFRPISGANTMCTVTALLETGSLPSVEPETVVRVDTAVGPVEATARVENGRVRWVRVRNVPSFALALDRKIVVPEYGTIPVDVAFGGQLYVMAGAADMGVALGPEHAPRSSGPARRSSRRPASKYRSRTPAAGRHRDRPGHAARARRLPRHLGPQQRRHALRSDQSRRPDVMDGNPGPLARRHRHVGSDGCPSRPRRARSRRSVRPRRRARHHVPRRVARTHHRRRPRSRRAVDPGPGLDHRLRAARRGSPTTRSRQV